jgi:L,D-transpeptidase ErfK/SrfK
MPLRIVVFRLVVIALLCGRATTGEAKVREDLLGKMAEYTAAWSDTIPDIGISEDLGYVELLAANKGVDPWIPGEGRKIVLPHAHLMPAVARRGIVINLAEQRLYFFPAGKPPQTYPVGVPSWTSPLTVGTTRVVSKRVKPTWIPPASVRAEDPDLPLAVAPGPDNPLGAFALDTAWQSIVIHGTNRPYGVGRRVSHGCFRLYPADIERLFKQVSIGTEVTVINIPIKLGWSDGVLYLEAHPTLEQADELEATGSFATVIDSDIIAQIRREAGEDVDRVDWELVSREIAERSGIPVRVLARQQAEP